MLRRLCAARLRHRARARARARRGLFGADRRDRRRQVDPDRRTAARARRPRRRRRGARRRGAGRDQRRVRPAARPRALAGGGRLRGPGSDERPPAAAPRDRRPGQEPRLDQRQRGHGGAAARGGRPPGRHPRPACVAEPDAQRLGARAARRLRPHRRRRRWRRPGRAGGRRATRCTDARARQADLERERERLAWQLGEVDRLAPGRRRMGRAQCRALAPVERAGADRRGAGSAGPRVRGRCQRRRAGGSRGRCAERRGRSRRAARLA